MIFATGFKKPLTSLTIADRGDLLHVILDFHLMSKVKSEMDQFVKSLGTFNFISIMQQNPKLWKPYFVYTERKLTAGIIKLAIYTHDGSLLFNVFSYQSQLRRCLPW